MTVYMVNLIEPNPHLWERLAERWPDRHHIVNGTLAFAAPPGISTAMSVQEAVGIGQDSDAVAGWRLGMITELFGDADTAGTLPKASVEWLEAARKGRPAAAPEPRHPMPSGP